MLFLLIAVIGGRAIASQISTPTITIIELAEPYLQSVPEPFTIIGTLIGGTAALRMRKKLKSTAKL